MNDGLVLLSTLMILGLIVDGPLDEKKAICGDGFVLNSVFTSLTDATGFLSDSNVKQQDAYP